MLEPLGIGIHSVDLGHIKPGMVVAVLGCGPIGLFTLQMARLAGAAKIIATDRLTHRLQAAQELGADIIIQSENGLENPTILSEAGRFGVDAAFEAAGENEAVETAIDIVRPGGRVVLIGIPAVDRTEFTASTARRKGLTIALVRRMKHTYPRAIRLVDSEMIDIRTVVTHCFPITDYQQAFSVALNRQGIKVVIEP
jgi:L-iditol 2-dehydrogenase